MPLLTLACSYGNAQVFTGLNAALFALMSIPLWLERRDMRPALLPVAVLAASTAGAAYLYLATQDWLWSTLLSDYIGFWYLGIVALTVGFACDIVFFEARVSLNILGSLPSALVPSCRRLPMSAEVAASVEMQVAFSVVPHVGAGEL